MKQSRGTYFSVRTAASTLTDKKIFPSNIIANSIKMSSKKFSREDTNVISALNQYLVQGGYL